MKMKQDKTPLFDAITKYIETNPAYFRIPGHRLERGISERWTDRVGKEIFQYDVTETPMTDDLHNAEGPIKEAQELAAELFGAKRSFFLVNGTTCGNEAMIMSAALQGEKIMIARNAHKSAMMGLIIGGATPVYVSPKVCDEWGIQGGITAEDVEETFRQHPDCKALFLVSPSYYGICSDLEKIAKVCHAHDALLLVDEAHGGHVYFRDEENLTACFPKGALEQGADMCVQSMHKITGSLTQSSILHIGSERVDQEFVAHNLQIVQSTSPSYLLMNSLDCARYELAMHGVEMNVKAMEMACSVRNQIRQIPGMACMGTEVVGQDGIRYLDETRLVISARKMGISGYDLDKMLFEQYHVDMELSDQENVLAIMTYANTKEDGERLVQALQTIAEKKVMECEDSKQTTVVESKKRNQKSVTVINNENKMEEQKKMILNLPFPAIPQQSFTPREAYFSKKTTIFWKDAVGKISGEMLAPYPPGIPVIYPGEVVTEEIWNFMEVYRAGGHPMHGPADATLETLQIIELGKEL